MEQQQRAPRSRQKNCLQTSPGKTKVLVFSTFSVSLEEQATHQLPFRDLCSPVPAHVDVERAITIILFIPGHHRDLRIPDGIGRPIHSEGPVVDGVARVWTPDVELDVEDAVPRGRVLREGRVRAPADEDVAAVPQNLIAALEAADEALRVIGFRYQAHGAVFGVDLDVFAARAIRRAPNRARDVVVVEQRELLLLLLLLRIVVVVRDIDIVEPCVMLPGEVRRVARGRYVGEVVFPAAKGPEDGAGSPIH